MFNGITMTLSSVGVRTTYNNSGFNKMSFYWDVNIESKLRTLAINS